jgi:hypothetical protein
MSNEIKHVNSAGHGDYERKDITVAGVVYFLIGLGLAVVVVYFIANGIFAFLNNRFEAEQKPVSPLVTNAPKDTRHIPSEYKTDAQGADYEKYLKKSFPAPQLEVNERTELNGERLREEDTLSTYGWVDQNAGKVRIPIDRAMDLLVQRGLPVRSGGAREAAAGSVAQAEKKGSKK